MMVSASLGQLIGLKKETIDVTLDSGKLWWAFLQILIDRIISDEKQSLVETLIYIMASTVDCINTWL